MSDATRPGGHTWALLAGLAVAVSGCCGSYAERGAGTGAVLGTVAGTVVGAAAGRPLTGAAVGAGLGAVAGGAHGAAIDRAERRVEAQVAAQKAITLRDVVDLTASGSSDEVIINQIRTCGAVYNLTAQDVIWLQNNNVREPVIRELQATAYRPVRHVYTAVPVGPPAYVYPVPPPPVGVGVGVTFGGRR